MRERQLPVDFEMQLELESRTRKRGHPVLTVALFLCALAALSTAAVRMCPSEEPVGAVAALRDEVVVVEQAVGELYAGQPDYGGLNDAMLAASGSLPAGMVFGKTLRHFLGGEIAVSAAETGGWKLRLEGLPTWACLALATSEQNAASVHVASAGRSAEADGPVMDPRSARTACGGGGDRFVELTFR